MAVSCYCILTSVRFGTFDILIDCVISNIIFFLYSGLFTGMDIPIHTDGRHTAELPYLGCSTVGRTDGVLASLADQRDDSDGVRSSMLFVDGFSF